MNGGVMMTMERRIYKRYRPKSQMQAVLLPFVNISEERHQLNPIIGAVVDYSDGGVRAEINNTEHKDFSRSIWLNQDLYLILELADQTSFTLKGTIVRFEGHPRDDIFRVGIKFSEEEPTKEELIEIENIKEVRAKLTNFAQTDAEEV